MVDNKSLFINSNSSRHKFKRLVEYKKKKHKDTILDIKIYTKKK